MKELLNLEQEIMSNAKNKQNALSIESIKTNMQLALKFRREILKSAASMPEYIFDFCIKFQKNDKNLLKEFIFNTKYDEKLKEFLVSNEEVWLQRTINTKVEYKDIFDFFFGKDTKYERNAYILAKSSTYWCLEFFYIVINYIDDNFPVTIKRNLTDEEKRFIKYLLFRGDELDYRLKYKFSQEELESLIENICYIYKCRDINSALNFVLIEKYFRNKNTEVITLLRDLHGV